MSKKKSGSGKLILLVIVILVLLGVVLIGKKSLIDKKVPVVAVPTVVAQPYADEITVVTPSSNENVTSPLTITGKAKGMWYFEGSFPADLVDENGVSLGTVALTAKGDWMTEDFVDFEGKIEFTPPVGTTGKLIIKNDNPSGMPENDKTLEIPVKF